MKKGFTLIEIIVVLIILGVLAAIALPSLFIWIERSKSAEAIIGFKHVADVIDACRATGASPQECMDEIGVDFVGVLIANTSFATPNFIYQLLAAAPPGQEYGIIAIRVGADGNPLHNSPFVPIGSCPFLGGNPFANGWDGFFVL